MTQQALPYQAHSHTSHAAAERMRPKAETKRWKVLKLYETQIRMRDGLTDEEGIIISGMNPSTYRPRRIELARDGWLEDSGETRPTRSGSQAVVWRLKQ